MSNASVSSQVYIVRNAGTLSAVSVGTMVLYTDGTDLFAKDAAGVVHNLSTVGPGSVSLAISDLTDVVTSGLLDGQILVWDSTNGEWSNADLSLALDDLNNVNVVGATVGQVLQWDGANWVAATVSSGSLAGLFDVSDVYDYDSGTAPTDGQALTWDNANSRWAPTDTVNSFTVTDGSNTFTVNDGASTRFTAGTGLTSVATTLTKQIQYSLSANISDLGDVSTSGVNPGDVLQWTGSAWSNSALSIDELSDVDTTSAAPTAGQALVWDGVNSIWVPGTVGSGVTGTGTAGLIQVSDGSGGLAASSWNASGHLVPAINVSYTVGQEYAAISKVYSGPDGIFISSVTSPSTEPDYAEIKVATTDKHLKFVGVVNGSTVNYDFVAGTNEAVKLSMLANGQEFSFKAPSNLSADQNLVLPDTAPAVNKALVVSSAGAGNQYGLDWVEFYEKPLVASLAHKYTLFLGGNFSSTGYVDPHASLGSSVLLLGTNDTIVSGGTNSGGIRFRCMIPAPNYAITQPVTFTDNLIISFLMTGTPTLDFNSTTASVNISLSAKDAAGVNVGYIINTSLSAQNVVASTNYRTITISAATLSAAASTISPSSKISFFFVEIDVWNFSTSITMSGSSTLTLNGLALPFNVNLG